MNREAVKDVCLQTLLLLFKYANHKNKRSFVLTANEALVGALMAIGDVNNIFPIVFTPSKSKTILIIFTLSLTASFCCRFLFINSTDDRRICRDMSLNLKRFVVYFKFLTCLLLSRKTVLRLLYNFCVAQNSV